MTPHLQPILAADGIPLHYGDERREYHAALEAAVLMDRSHEGRLEVTGRDRLDLLHRISTNDLLTLQRGEGRPTLFTNAIARILDRATVYPREERLLVVTEPGRGEALQRYLQRNIFFNDEAYLSNLAAATRQFVLHGPNSAAILQPFIPEVAPLHGVAAEINEAAVFIARDKPISGDHWRLIVANENADQVWAALLDTGVDYGLIEAGTLTYTALRVRAGRPGVGHELTPDYIPLELGLWDEVSFSKGCYTGQEILARMESRGRLAKTIVLLTLSEWIEAPARITVEGREVGMLTSSVQTPDGEKLGIGVIKVAAAQIGARVVVAERIDATISGLPGAQPPQLAED